MTAPERDEEFEAYLQRRSSLQRELSEHDGLEPPPELDRIVLTRARQAISAPPDLPLFKPARWAIPLALAATIVVSFTIVVSISHVRNEDALLTASDYELDSGSGGRIAERQLRAMRSDYAPSQDASELADAEPADAEPVAPATAAPGPAASAPATSAPATSARAASTPAASAPALSARTSSAPSDAAPSVAAQKSAADERARSEANASARRQLSAQESDAMQDSDAVAAVTVDPPSPELARAEEAPPATDATGEEEPESASPAAPSKPIVVASRREAEAGSANSVEEVMVTGATRKSAPSPSRAERRADPDVWIEYIEDLRARGRHRAADRELRDLRKAYPDYPIPPEAQRPE